MQCFQQLFPECWWCEPWQSQMSFDMDQCGGPSFHGLHGDRTPCKVKGFVQFEGYYRRAKKDTICCYDIRGTMWGSVAMWLGFMFILQPHHLENVHEMWGAPWKESGPCSHKSYISSKFPPPHGLFNWISFAPVKWALELLNNHKYALFVVMWIRATNSSKVIF